MKVLVCGGRTYSDRFAVGRVLNEIHGDTPIHLVIHGGARGADSLAHEWARQHKIACAVYPADWDTHGFSAGPIRNQAMLDTEKPDLVVAFPGGTGAHDMVRRAYKLGVKVREIPR